MILSIVIPVYKVEEYIEKCLVSCSNQDISKNDYELIVVNDGSPDKSLEICERLLPSIENMAIVSQKNKGLSGARNTGLKHAKGNYVWFVDSDDWLEGNCLGEIISRIKEQQSDIFWLGHDVVSNDKVIDAFTPSKLEHSISGEDFFINHLNDLFYIWKFIYKREFLINNDLTFYEGILYEDLEFTPRALYVATSCFTFPDVYYHYLMRDGSIINNFKIKNLENRFFIFDRLINFMQREGVSKEFYQKCFKSIISSVLSTLRTSARSNLKLTNNVKDIIIKIKIKQFLNLSSKLHLFLIKFNPDLYVYFFNKMYKVYNKLKR